MQTAQLPLRILSVLTVLLLFGSRWFSYLGFAPIFVSDVLFAIAVLAWLLSPRKTEPSIRVENEHNSLTVVFSLLIIWVLIRGVFSISDGYQILDILRDIVPFFYIAIALIVASQIQHQSADFRSQLSSWIYRALTFHLIWCLAVVFLGSTSGIRIGAPFEAGLFSFRADIDTALVVVLFMLALRKWLNGVRGVMLGFNLLGCLAVVSFSPARSSLIALLLCLLWVLADKDSIGRSAARKTATNSRAALILVGTLLASVVLMFTTAGARLLGGLGLSGANSDLTISAIGTSTARELVWSQVLEWVNSSTVNILFGAGFGINFLDVTQTLQFLEGTTYTGVRSPHNFLITVIARLGWPAAITFTLIFLIIAFRFRKSSTLDDLSFIAMIIFLAFIPISLLGVILEAPFGAIPFYFSIGILLGSRVKADSLLSQRAQALNYISPRPGRQT